MIGQPLYRMNLLASERTTLETLIRKQTTPQHLAKRARMILLANGEAATDRAISEPLGVTPAQVTMWTKRWIERAMEPLADRLADWPRSGRPDTITAERWCQILALACEPPEQYGHPLDEPGTGAGSDPARDRATALGRPSAQGVNKKGFAATPQPVLAQCQGR